MSKTSLALAVLLAALAGCAKKKEAAPAAESEGPPTEVKADPGLVPFAKAVRGPDDPPPDADRPPDVTVHKRPVHRLLAEVKDRFDEVKLTGANGKPLTYTAVVETNHGTMQIALFPDLAPNHVRNFVALARSGYYDGLFVDRARHERNPETGEEVHQLEAGCPLGTGAAPAGSIGYWVKQEFTPADKMSHDEGAVGACRGIGADTAGTRFYINLTKAPALDGNFTLFGKVVQGLDVLRKIAKEPLVIDDEGVGRPEKPVVITKVTILSKEAEAADQPVSAKHPTARDEVPGGDPPRGKV